MIKFQQSQALTSHFENFWSIVEWLQLRIELDEVTVNITLICILYLFLGISMNKNGFIYDLMLNLNIILSLIFMWENSQNYSTKRRLI